jgi:nucleotidyltransferase substrate binding protein (TIGR01987 family)
MVFERNILTMATAKILLTPLQNAISRLEEGYARYQKDTGDTQIRDGLIQRYEFTYEVSHKTLKRHLEAVSPNPDIYDAMPFSDLIRSANEQDLLLSDWNKWKIFREMRAKSSHTYDEDIALEVVSVIPKFISEAKALLQVLQKRNA